MTINERDFLLDTNYNPQSNFSRVKFGINKALLETELNEMQKIQEDARASLIRQIVPTGFLENVRKDFVGQPIVYSPNNLDNTIAIAPAKLIVNGYELTIEGKDKVNGIDGYTIIDLGEAPFAATKYYDFIFLEVWFQELTADSNVHKYGFIDGAIIKNNMVDDRVKDETSRRVALQYKVKVQQGVDIDKWPDGFGFKNINEYSNIYASGPKDSSIENSNYLFISAINPMLKDAVFYGDSGLFVAGRPGVLTTNEDFGILNNYIFGVPLLAVKRRNQKPYSLEEPNGAPKYINSLTASNRPDNLFYNRVVEKDVKDIRKIVSFGQMNESKLFDDGFKKLLTGNLKSKSKEVVERIQFGVTPIDISSRTDVILDVQFSKSLSALIGPNPTSVGTPKYDLCATGYGLIVDGQTTVSYKPSPVLNWISKDMGTIEFFIKPYWDGADSSISQKIFSITDDSGNVIMEFAKEQGNFVFTQKQNASASSDVNKTLVLLNNYKVNNNGVYHIRLTWDKNYSKTSIYINGQEAGFSNYLLSALTPTTFKIGAIESVNSYSSSRVGFVIDELLIYNVVLDEVFPQVSSDIISGYAKLYPSFNGVLRSFKDNSYIQKDLITNLTTTSGNNKIIVNAPYGTTISTSTPVVYNSLTGDVYVGTWTGLNTATATFTLSSGNFSGEKVWVKHDIYVAGGNGVDNIPLKVLKAEMNGLDVAFSKDSDSSREVKLINEDGTIEVIHKAFDYNSVRTGEDAHSRVIRYVIESNGTNKYVIPNTVYGSKVMGIKLVSVPLSKISKTQSGDFIVELVSAVNYNDTFSVDLALEGFTFDYDPHSKSIVSNMLQAKTITINATGNTDTFTIPTFSETTANGGVITAFLKTYDVRNSTNTVFGTSVYLDGNQVNVTSISGIGTPFITVKFESTPQLNKVIEIPVLVTYQPLTSDKLSVWYEYVPYQGILDNSQKNLKRLTDWKFFCTTLGSGNIFVDNIKENSINNAANRLPGGQKMSYALTGDDIVFQGDQFTQTGSIKANKKFRIVKEATDIVHNNGLDDDFIMLNADITIQKLYGDHQDSKLAPPFGDQGFYLNDTSAISKYLGAGCLVVDDMGNILLFIIGQIKVDPTSQSIVKAVHGDLFKLDNAPILITRRY